MSSMSKGKKKTSQDELRRIMNLQKEKLAQSARKIDSPLAKYTSDGKLMCVVCNHEVKSESVWIIHVNSKMHRDNIAKSRKKKEPAPAFVVPVAPPPVSVLAQKVSKRPLKDQEESVPPKKVKGILVNSTNHSKVPDDFFDSNHKVNKLENRPSSGKTINSLVDFPDSDSDDEEKPQKDVPTKIEEVESAANDEQVAINNSDNPLPEGFFDDPVMDAKVRNVEYKNPGDEEWERFQKELKEVESQSAQMIAEDQEESTAERQILELDEQLRNWSRVRDMEVKKENVKVVGSSTDKTDSGNYSSSEEDEFSEFLDWRSKRS